MFTISPSQDNFQANEPAIAASGKEKAILHSPRCAGRRQAGLVTGELRDDLLYRGYSCFVMVSTSIDTIPSFCAPKLPRLADLDDSVTAAGGNLLIV